MTSFSQLRPASPLILLLLAFAAASSADPVRVRQLVGTIHAFLEIRSAENQLLGDGDLIQDVHGNLVTTRSVLHFKDGSLDDETTVFTERGQFHLISDRHIQKGPYFPHPLDMSIDARTGQIIVRSTGRDGKVEVTTDHLDLPPDLYNGLIPHIIENIPPGAPATTVSPITVHMIVATPKPRLVKLAISPAGQDSFSIMGSPHQSIHYEIKIELGGVAGVVAPVIGKQPPNIQAWITAGQAPTFLKEVGPLYSEGPILTLQLVSPSWPTSHPAK